MSEGGKRVDVRLGSFACSIRGFDEPGPVLAALLASVRDALAAAPRPPGAPEELDHATAERLLRDAAAASGLAAEELEVAHGLLVTARPVEVESETASDSEEEAEPAAEPAAPRLDAEASAEIKRALEQAARLPSDPDEAAAMARSRFGRRDRQLDAPAGAAAAATVAGSTGLAEDPVEEESVSAEPADAMAEDVGTIVSDAMSADDGAPSDDVHASAEEMPMAEARVPDAAEAIAPEAEAAAPEAVEPQAPSPEEETADPTPAPLPDAEPEVVDTPEEQEEPLLLNIFDTPPPRETRAGASTTTGRSLFGAAPHDAGDDRPQGGFGEVSHRWTGAEGHRDGGGTETSDTLPPAVPGVAPEPVLEESEEPAVAVGAPGGFRPGGFFGRRSAGGDAPGADPAPVALLRPLAKAAAPWRRGPAEAGAATGDAGRSPDGKPSADGAAAGPSSVQALAWRMAARSTPERILCAAAWLTFAGRSPRFSQRAIFQQLDAIEMEDERDPETRIEGFGELVSRGALIQLGTETFALSEQQLGRLAPHFD
ncbi:MAG: hypothetical protein AAF371_17320 [Pseudomonadota bacterium]